MWLWLWARHHTREARLWLERAIDVPERLDPLARARLTWTLAGAGVEQGDNEVARTRLAESTALFTEIGDAEGIALCGFLEASLAPLAGEHDRAIEVFTRTETQFLALGNVFLASICASTAGMILAQQGRFDEAQAHLDRGLAQARSIDNAMLLGAAAVSRGFARLGRGALDDAAADLADGARWAHACQNPETLSFACDGLAAVLLARGTVGDDAAALVGAAHGLRDRVGIVPWPGLRPVMAAIADGVRASVPPEVYAAGHARGRHLDLDAVLALTTRASAVPTRDPLVT
jgi:ATP/maltotriose-dependent transcriptional regulator MalT